VRLSDVRARRQSFIYPCNRPWRSMGLSRLPSFLDNLLTDDGEVVSLVRRPPFTPKQISDTHLFQRLSWPHGHSTVRRNMPIGESNELIGNRIRYLPAYTIVPQPTMLPRAPYKKHECHNFLSSPDAVWTIRSSRQVWRAPCVEEIWNEYEILKGKCEENLHSLDLGRKPPSIIHDGFSSTHVLGMKKEDNSMNFTAGGIINCRTHHNWQCRDKNKDYVTSYVMAYKAMIRVMLPRSHGKPWS
jgi:hypothetical protein